MKEIFLIDEHSCISVDDVPELAHRSFFTRLWESAVRLLSPLL